MKMTISDLVNYCYMFNKMDYDKEIANKLATLFIEKVGFKTVKNYGGKFGELQTYDWENGIGTIFHDKLGKIEIGFCEIHLFEHGTKKGYFLADFD